MKNSVWIPIQLFHANYCQHKAIALCLQKIEWEVHLQMLYVMIVVYIGYLWVKEITFKVGFQHSVNQTINVTFDVNACFGR